MSPDGLFTSRPSEPAPLNLDAIVGDVITFVHVDEDTKKEDPNLPVPATWEITDRRSPWPLLTIRGTLQSSNGQPHGWSVLHRIPCWRATKEDIVRETERALVKVQIFVEEQRAENAVFLELEPARV